MFNKPILKQAQDKLKPFELKLLDAFSRLFARKRPPQSMRALAPLGMVFLLEAFGLAYLLDRATVRLAIVAARGPGKGDDDDLLGDSDEMTAIRWATARHEAIDRAYNIVAHECYKGISTPFTYNGWLKAGHGPNRETFEQQWGQRNPIDLATAPKCFDPSAQLSILDAVGQGDGYLGVFVSTSFLTSSAPKQIACMGQTLSLDGCESIDAAAAKAVLSGWIAYLDHRGVVTGVRLIPRTDGIQTRLRAPLVNIVSMMHEPLSDRDAEIEIETLKTKLSIAENNHKNVCDQRDTILERLTAECDARDALFTRDKQWQDATGADKPEDVERAVAERRARISDVETSGVWRMVWPDKDAAPASLACTNAIVAHRRGEFAELEFPSTPKIFEQVRAWLGYYQFGIYTPSFDSSKYGHCAIGANGEIPPLWSSMKEAKRNAYPGFVLFAPDGSARVVFRAKEATIGKVGKRKAREAKS